jgi:hypothetical protein
MNLPFEWQIGWRYTRAGRAGRRNGFISFISGVSMLGIALGVAALIIVLSVMNGFQKEVRDRMLSVIPHIEVFDVQGAGLPDWRATAATAKKNPAVVAAAPFISQQSLIARGDTPSRLPSMVLLPGIMHKGPVDPNQPKEVQEAREKLAKIIFELPQGQASEWYFNKLKQESEKHGYTWGKKGMKIPGAPKPGGDGEGEDEGWTLFPSDEHGGWDDIPEELRDIVEGKIKHALRKASNKADGSPNGWGNIPSELREEIRAYAFGSVDWKAVLRNFCGNLRTGERSRSIKRIDRRAPYMHPGLKRGRNPSVVVLVDQSGSVSDEVLSRFFGALDGLARKMTFDVVPFDHTVAVADRFEWKRGQKPALKRVRGGGTSFDAAIEYVNDPRNRGKWEGAIMLTDGECSQPRACRVKLCYVIAPGHKLMFEPRNTELVVQMSDKDKDGKSGW